jgi:ATP-binding cassette subfamily B protein
MSRDFAAHLNDLKRVYVRAKFLSYLVQRLPTLTFILVQLVVLSIGAVMTYWNWLSVGTLVSYQVLLLGLNLNIISFTFALPYFIEGGAAMQRIGDILAELPEFKEAPDAIDLPHLSKEICFDDVSFSYSC